MMRRKGVIWTPKSTYCSTFVATLAAEGGRRISLCRCLYRLATKLCQDKQRYSMTAIRRTFTPLLMQLLVVYGTKEGEYGWALCSDPTVDIHAKYLLYLSVQTGRAYSP